ncbi:MAG: FixH family protein [Bacteroidetes bacterium]|nr:FixH family protein [Bacteroidota bacterium]
MSEQKAKRVYHPWAVGTTIVIAVFLVATITLVVIISQQDYDLVTQNYYEKDLGYQKEIDTRQRTGALDEKPRLELDRTAKVCNVSFPSRADYSGISGEVVFYRISDANRDLRHPLSLTPEGRQYISVSGLQPGQWIAKLRWTEGGQEYYIEERIYLE